MGKRRIRKVAIIGSGVMGSQIACHFANIGVESLLLDIVPQELNAKEEASNLSLNDAFVRNRIAREALQSALKLKPNPLYLKGREQLVKIGNLEDDIKKIEEADWVIEVVVERLDVKKQVFENVDQHRKKGSIVSSNTSGIPIEHLIEGRSEDFCSHFLGTHFFNPPRYLELLEIIPSSKTDASLVDFLMEYGQLHLGKKTVLCKDTPAFIANRIGVFSIMSLFHIVKDSDLTVTEVDQLSGPILGRPKSATFRTCDVVGLDTLAHVAKGVHDNCPNDEAKSSFINPNFIQHLLDNNFLGAKSGQGFYKKEKDENGKRKILALNLKTLEYEKQSKSKFDCIAAAKKVSGLENQMKELFNHSDKGGQFYRKIFYALFSYVSFRIPEIADSLSQVDAAMRAGFGWQLGPFETWDALGFEKVCREMKKEGYDLAPWVDEALSNKVNSLYQIESNIEKVYQPASKTLEINPGNKHLTLGLLKEKNCIWKNKDASIIDLGDGILNLEFHSKMNTIGSGIIQGINKAIDLAEEEYDGLVIYNTGANFSVGANVGMIFMMAVEQEYDELHFAIKQFQNTMMRVRYSAIPVVVACHQMALGGGCELAMHADKVVAHAETYMGLVEFGVGLIPGGGGTKEFALRLSDEIKEGDIRTNAFRNRFLTIGQAQVATSALEAFHLGYLRPGIDEICMSRELQLEQAKKAAIALSEKGYNQAPERENIQILGNEALGLVYAGANSMMAGNYISEHDQLISEKLGFVLAGGDISERSFVSERYLLDLERKAFVELCATRKTLERLQSMVSHGKILRN